MIVLNNFVKQLILPVLIVTLFEGCNKEVKTGKAGTKLQTPVGAEKINNGDEALPVDKSFPGKNPEEPEKVKADTKKQTSSVAKNTDPDCVEFVALWAAGDIAERLKKDKKWVFLNYTVDLWDTPPTESEGKVVGKLRASSYARIIEKRGDDYQVESPVNQVQGWISSEHVKTTSWKNPKTRKLCK